MGTNQKPLTPPVTGTPAPLPNDIDAEQTSYKHYVDAVTERMLHGGRQTPNPDANAGVFQPTPARIVGDLVTGGPRDGYPAQGIPVDLGADMATGGEPDATPLTPGSQNPDDYYREIKDFPGGQGSGAEPLQPGGQDGT